MTAAAPQDDPHPERNRVVLTGMGWVTPLGADVDSVWGKLLAGASAIGPVSNFAASTFATNFAAEVRGFELAHFFHDAAPFAGAHPHVRFLLGAAAQAWKRAGLGDVSKPGGVVQGFPALDAERVGVYLGSGEGEPGFGALASSCVDTWDPETRRVDTRRWVELARERMSAVAEVNQEPNVAVTHLADAFGCRGPAFNCMTACAASTQSVGEAYELLKRGDADVMLAGGSHSMIHPLGMTGFIRLTAMSTRRDEPASASRPFDSTRDGFVMGEGAGVVVLERLDHALARGAEPICEVAGYGSSADAYRITDIEPAGRGAMVAMRTALAHAGIDPRSPGPDGRPPVHYISAHGTGTPENDGIESAAVRGVFGELAGGVPFSSVKSMIGHLIQAAGAVELVTCVQAIRTGFVPPTINLRQHDPRCGLDHVPGASRDLRGAGGVDVAMSNGFGFGGQNDSIVVRRYAA